MLLSTQQASQILREMKSLVHHDINLIDTQGVIFASTNPAREGQFHPGALQILREGLSELNVRENDGSGMQPGVNLPIHLDGQLEGVIGITGDPAEVGVFGGVMRRMLEIMLEDLRRKDLDSTVEQARALFLENWLFSAEPDWKELEQRGRLLEIDISQPYVLLRIQLFDVSAPGGAPLLPDELHSAAIVQAIQNELPARRGQCCAALRNQILVLLRQMPLSDTVLLAQRLCRVAGRGYPASVQAYGGISSSGSGAELRRCYLQASTACTLASRSSKGNVLYYDRVSLEFLLQSVPRLLRDDLRESVFTRCPAQDVPAYARLIRLFFASGGDLNRCAAALGVHRNTVQYRLERLTQLTGYDLRRPGDAAILFLAVLDQEEGR